MSLRTLYTAAYLAAASFWTCMAGLAPLHSVSAAEHTAGSHDAPSEEAPWEGDVEVSAQLDQDNISPTLPIHGTISIQHDVDQSIDPSSFFLENAPFHVKHLRDVEIAPDSPLRISLFRFEIEPQPSGLHLLPSISMKVGGKKYTTAATTYEVPALARTVEGSAKIILKLEPFVGNSKPLYVGQQTVVGYRIFYNENFDLKTQQLPLLEAKGFKKIGGDRISDIRQGALAIRMMEQDIEATTPGTYAFGPSFIVGYRYRNDSKGRKLQQGQEIRAEAPTLQIEVLDFPQLGKPPSFNGAIGEGIEFSVELLSHPEIYKGDKVSLALHFASDKDLSGIKLPELCCEPGFPGFFELSDIPPIPTPGNGSILYFVEMRSLTDKIRELPSIEFSYFNPKTEKYEVRKSKPIPLKVTAPPDKELPIAPEIQEPPEKATQNKEASAWTEGASKVQSIEIETIYPLEVSDLSDRNFGTWAALLILPMGIIALYIQMDLIQRRERRNAQVKQKESSDFLEQAKAATNHESEFYHLLEQALLLRLEEQGHLTGRSSTYHDLPMEGKCKEVREFIAALEEARFAAKEEKPRQEMIEDAAKLFYSIEARRVDG